MFWCWWCYLGGFVWVFWWGCVDWDDLVCWLLYWCGYVGGVGVVGVGLLLVVSFGVVCLSLCVSCLGSGCGFLIYRI